MGEPEFGYIQDRTGKTIGRVEFFPEEVGFHDKLDMAMTPILERGKLGEISVKAWMLHERTETDIRPPHELFSKGLPSEE